MQEKINSAMAKLSQKSGMTEKVKLLQERLKKLKESLQSIKKAQ